MIPELGDLQDDRGDPALHRAAAWAQVDCIKHLCKPEVVNIPGAQGKTALHRAIIRGSSAAVEYLLKHGADVNGDQSYGFCRSPLAEALRRRDREEIVNILLDWGAEMETTTQDGWRPLHYAAYHGHERLARRLLSAGCTVEVQTKLGETPFFFAIFHGHTEIIRLFLASDIESVSNRAFGSFTYAHLAADYGRLEVLQHMVCKDKGVIFIKDEEGRDLLYLAAASGHDRVVEFLIGKGIGPDGLGFSEETPLCAAARAGRVGTVTILLKMGAKVNATDVWMRSALSWAVLGRHLGTARQLLRAGANPHLRDAVGFSAVDYSDNSPAIMDVVRPWGAVSHGRSPGHGHEHRLRSLVYCVSRYARALAEPTSHTSRDLRPPSTIFNRQSHLHLMLSALYDLALLPYTPQPHLLGPTVSANQNALQTTLLSRKVSSSVPVQKTEILREWKILHADSDVMIRCNLCHGNIRGDFHACSICKAYHCQKCHLRLVAGEDTHKRVKAMKELQDFEADVEPIRRALLETANKDLMMIGRVLCQDHRLRYWVLDKCMYYKFWTVLWHLYHFRSARFMGWNAVKLMGHMLSIVSRNNEMGAANGYNNEQFEDSNETRCRLRERWQAFVASDQNSGYEACTHDCFIKASRKDEALREKRAVFEGSGRLSAQVFDLLAEKYETALKSEILTHESLQATRFSNPVPGGTQSSKGLFGSRVLAHNIGDPGRDLRRGTTSAESASERSEDDTWSTASSIVKVVSYSAEFDEAGQHIDIEDVLENLLVKRQALVREGPLTEENDLVLETAWKMAQAIVYHGTPRPSLGDIADQGVGDGYYTAPGTPTESSFLGNVSGASEYRTARSISLGPWIIEGSDGDLDGSEHSRST